MVIILSGIPIIWKLIVAEFIAACKTILNGFSTGNYPSAAGTPPKQGRGGRMHIGNYLQVLKEEEEWENLPNAFVLDWFYYPRNAVTERNSAYATQAFADVAPEEGNYPVVIYAPSCQASSSENFMLCDTVGYTLPSPS